MPHDSFTYDGTPEESSRWVVCQIGGREHYGIPRALHGEGRLLGLVTDFWVAPGSLFGRLPGARRLADRFHEDLRSARVLAPNARMLGFEFGQRLKAPTPWDQIIKRNRLFQRLAIESFDRLVGKKGRGVTLFSYSYAALDLFREAKARGWGTVLGQIDPGLGEDCLVKKLRERHPEWVGIQESSPPESYWQAWREECALADRILVNSEWSRSLIAGVGIARSKIEVLPLAYDADEKFRIQKLEFKIQNPLRVLFLGQAIIRKGIQDLVAAAHMLGDVDIEINIVGPHGDLPTDLPSNIRFHGAVPRSEAVNWYRRADVFVLPTHSDGFALTQLEAMSHGLPVIATPACGEVVKDGVDGWKVPAGSPHALAEKIRWFAQHPQERSKMRVAAIQRSAEFTIERVARGLLRPGSLE